METNTTTTNGMLKFALDSGFGKPNKDGIDLLKELFTSQAALFTFCLVVGLLILALFIHFGKKESAEHFKNKKS